jgi:hypothetical protein
MNNSDNSTANKKLTFSLFLNNHKKNLEKTSWGHFLIRLLQIPVAYFKEIRWENDENYGVTLIQQFWHSGILGRTALILIVLSLIFTVSVLNSTTGIAISSTSIIGMIGMVAAFSFLIAASIHQPGWIFFIASAYTCWYLLPVGINLAGTWSSSLPVLWMLVLGWANSTSNPRISRLDWGFLLLCLGAGQLLYRPFGFDQIIPDQFSLLARIIFGILLFSLSQIKIIKTFSIKTKSWLDKTTLIFMISLVIFGVFILFACLNNFSSTVENLLLSMRSALGLVDLFWFWLGWTVFEGIIDLSGFSVRQSMQLLSAKTVYILSPILWVLSTFFCWSATRPLPIPLLILMKKIGFLDWIYTWSDPFYFTVHGFIWFCLPVMIIYLFFLLRKKINQKLFGLLNIVWAAGFFGLLSYYQSMFGLATLETDSQYQFTAWASLVLVGGILWEFAKSSGSYWESDSQIKIFTFSAILLLLLGIASVTLGAGLPDLVNEYTLYSFFGTIYLGLPLAVYTLLPQFFDFEPLAGKHLILFFLLGCISAIICLTINPFSGWHILLVPLLWSFILFFVCEKLVKPGHGWHGASTGAAISLGFITFWFTPEYIPIPFLSFINELQLSYLTEPLYRPILLPQHVQITIATLLIGLITGWLWFRTTNRIFQCLLIILAALVLAMTFFIILPN